jgi:hypothetical protein
VYGPGEFAKFVNARPLAGLGADVDLVRRIVADDVETLTLLDAALKNPTGLHNVQATAPTGNSKDRALRKLRTDHPALHADIVETERTRVRAVQRIGELLGPATVGRPVVETSQKSEVKKPQVEMNRDHQARLLAAYPEVVDAALAKPKPPPPPTRMRVTANSQLSDRYPTAGIYG